MVLLRAPHHTGMVPRRDEHPRSPPASNIGEAGDMILDSCSVPIVLAPLAGGPSTPELTATVSEAGGLGRPCTGTAAPPSPPPSPRAPPPPPPPRSPTPLQRPPPP